MFQVISCFDAVVKLSPPLGEVTVIAAGDGGTIENTAIANVCRAFIRIAGNNPDQAITGWSTRYGPIVTAVVVSGLCDGCP